MFLVRGVPALVSAEVFHVDMEKVTIDNITLLLPKQAVNLVIKHKLDTLSLVEHPDFKGEGSADNQALNLLVALR